LEREVTTTCLYLKSQLNAGFFCKNTSYDLRINLKR
jgi:hypothetical protein